MAHVLHLIESLEHGGAERVLVQLATAQRRRHRVTVCCLKRLGPLRAMLPEGVDVVCLNKAEGDDPRLIPALAREIARRQVDIVHTHAWGVFLEGGIAAWWAGASRLVHTAHGPYRSRRPGLVGGIKWWSRRLLERLVSRRFDALVGVSESVAADMRRLGFDAAKVGTVHNGIALDAPRADSHATGDVVLVTVGRLAAIKNQAAMLEAVARLQPRLPGLRLRIVGDGPERERLRARIDELGLGGQVELVGFRDDVAGLLAEADIFLLTSDHEGISIALLEAMRAGLSVIATAVGGVPETLVDGQSGVLVDVDDPRALCRAIELLAVSPQERRRLGEGARTRVAEQFSVDAMARGYERLYERRTVLPRSAPGAATVTPMTPSMNRPLRILYHHRTQGRGAEGVHIASIVRALEGMGHEVDLVSPPGVDPLSTAGAAPVDKADVRTSGTGAMWKAVSRRLPGVAFELAEIGYNLMAWRLLRQALDSRHYDLIYERYAFYMVAGGWLARRRGIPFVLEANEVNGLEERARRQWMPWLAGCFERFLLRRCTAVLTVSSYLRDLALKQGMAPERVRVVPNAIDPRALAPVERDRDLVARYGLSGRTVMGFAGWFDRWDRLDLLLEALSQLRPRFPRLAVLLIGDGPLLADLRARVRELGLDDAVVTCGAVPRDTIHEHLALLDIAVLPHSNRFGSPVVMFELMARRVPIVAPRLAPMQDVLVDGETAQLFDPLDQGQMIEALARYLESPELRQSTAARAYEQLSQRHTWSQNAEVILASAGFATHPEEARRAS